MNTIDQYINIILLKCKTLDSKTIARFRGLEITIKNHVFLTQGQADFCIHLMEQNKDIIKEYIPEILDVLKNPTWSRQFRQLENVKTVDIRPNENFNEIVITAPYSNTFKSIISSIDKNIGLNLVTPGKCYKVKLTENNLVIIVDKLLPLGFTISDEIMTYYEIIKPWKYKEEVSKFLLHNIKDEEYKQSIVNDIGSDLSDDLLLIKDRRLRHQYFIQNDNINESTSLVEILAERTTPKIWIDNSNFTLDELVSSLKRLKRTPILFVFDQSNIKKIINDLYNVSNALERNGITDNIGIYFRLPNVADGKIFNEFIHEKNYNTKLDKTTNVVGIDVKTLPKFLLTSDWEPMSIISIGNNLRNKALIYANRCDLIITYSNEQPIIYSRNW